MGTQSELEKISINYGWFIDTIGNRKIGIQIY